MKSEAAKELDVLTASMDECHGWKMTSAMSGVLYEAERLYTLAGEQKASESVKRRRLQSISSIRLVEDTEKARTPGTTYLCRFLALLNEINTKCPWCCARFPVNDLMLCKMSACLLPYIVESPAVAKTHAERLQNLIRSDLKGSNMLWASPFPMGSGLLAHI